MACDLDTLNTAMCASGIGKLRDPITLWQVIAQLSCAAGSSGCGTPTLSVEVSGAGTSDANGTYTSDDGGETFLNANGYSMSNDGATWTLVSGAFNSQYTISVADFPCGTWALGTFGVAPPPTAAYV